VAPFAHPNMVRIIFAIGLVALILIAWFLLQPMGGSIRQIHDAALQFAKCLDGHSQDIAGIMRDSGDATSGSDMEFNQYRAKIKMQEIQAACLDQSGFKTLVLRELDNTAMTDSDKAGIRRELTEAQTIEDLERIQKEIESAEQHR
jgi:hypothetical protein